MVVVKLTLTPTVELPTIPTQRIQVIEKIKDLDLSTHPVRPVVKLITSKGYVTLEQTQPTDRLSGRDE